MQNLPPVVIVIIATIGILVNSATMNEEMEPMNIINGKMELTETIIQGQTTTTEGGTKNKRKVRDLLINQLIHRKNRPRPKWKTGGSGIVCVTKPFSVGLDKTGGTKATRSFQSFAVLPLQSGPVSAYTGRSTPFAWKAQPPKL
tara:strand:- start:1625 stop:2056 length:432 start_codon:yes stop_codon:yes gene_type:complete